MHLFLPWVYLVIVFGIDCQSPTDCSAQMSMLPRNRLTSNNIFHYSTEILSEMIKASITHQRRQLSFCWSMAPLEPCDFKWGFNTRAAQRPVPSVNGYGRCDDDFEPTQKLENYQTWLCQVVMSLRLSQMWASTAHARQVIYFVYVLILLLCPMISLNDATTMLQDGQHRLKTSVANDRLREKTIRWEGK